MLACLLTASANGTKILPRTTAFPPPFGSFLPGATANLRVAPLLIAQDQSPDGKSDVIVAMGGSGSAGGVSLQITGGTGNPLILDNTVGFATLPTNPTGDLVLVSQSGITNCLLEEVSTNVTPNLNLGGTYLTLGTAPTTLASLGGSTLSYVTPLGNARINNVQFMLIGVDANHTLYSYDLLQNPNLIQNPGAADASQAIADGVYQLHAIYGIDTTGKGTLGAWAGPGDANYDINTVMQSQKTQLSIVAVRVAVVVRGEYYDKNMVNGVLTPVSPSTITLFSGLKNAANVSLQVPVNLTPDERQYRYRVFEFTVPLRNMILLANGP